VYQGNTGVQSASPVAIPFTADGQAAWMNVPTGNGMFTVALGAGNTGKAFTDVGVVSNPSAAAAGGYDYTVNFSVTGTGTSAVTTYTVTDNATATTSAAAPYSAGQSITFGGLSMVVRGAPANGDSLVVSASATSGPGTGVFGVLDKAIAGMYNAGSTTTGVSSTNPALQQSIARALAEIDVSMERISTAQGRAGDLLNRADTITTQQEARDTQLQTDRSNAEDIDAVKALSDVSTLQLGYDVALKSYAAIQKLSLFNYIS
jgi:flagellar hook-associated protein 3 FlgL